ncbi:MAG: aminopeptidase P N-terminal domain-containing protein [Bacilli bacterium]
MDAKEYSLRRDKLLSQVMEQSIVILFAGGLVKSSADATYPFVVNKNFFYLTGIEQENSILVMVKTPTTVKTYLFIDEIDETKTRWVGKKLDVDAASKVSGIHDVFMLSMFETRIKEMLLDTNGFGKITHAYLDKEKLLVLDGKLKTPENYAEELKLLSSQLIIENIYPLITKLRMIKSTKEIEAIRQAIKGTAYGLQSIRKHLKPGLYEHQIEALFQYAIKEYGNMGLAFETIIASGKNAVVLHYPNPKDKISDGALVLCDLGATYGQYRGDITRTYPANRKFNPLQRQVYSIVLKANQLIIQMAKPGLKIVDLQQAVVKFLSEAAVKEGLIKTAEDIGSIYYHNVGHHLGLDTHDPIGREIPLEPGCVITVEPGLYIKELGIGIRIEDNILITEQGCENLSIEIPKSIEELEA